MIFLLGYVVSALCFSQLLRLGQKRDCRTTPVVAVNYLLAAAVSVGAALWLGAWPARGREVLALLAAANGVLFMLHILAMTAGFRLAGTGVTWAFVSAGVVVPVLLSRLAWKEPMSAAQWLALAAVPPAVILLRPPRRTDQPDRKLGLKGEAVLLLCFLMAGAIGAIHKAQDVYARGLGPPAEGPVAAERLFYQAVLFSTALLASAGYLLWRHSRPLGREWRVGLAVGLANTSGLFFALLAIGALAAAVFFPTSGCLVIVGNTLAGRLLWRERLLRRQMLGLALALVVVVLASLRP